MGKGCCALHVNALHLPWMLALNDPSVPLHYNALPACGTLCIGKVAPYSIPITCPMCAFMQNYGPPHLPRTFRVPGASTAIKRAAL